MNLQNSAHSRNTISQRIYIILYVKSTQFFRLNVHKLQKSVHVPYFQGTQYFNEYTKICVFLQFFKECSKFFTFNKHYLSKNLYYFVRLKYAIFKRSYIIIYIQGTQFFEKYTILQTHRTLVIEKCILYSFFSFFQSTQYYNIRTKKTINSTYKNFQRRFEILHFQ